MSDRERAEQVLGEAGYVLKRQARYEALYERGGATVSLDDVSGTAQITVDYSDLSKFLAPTLTEEEREALEWATTVLEQRGSSRLMPTAAEAHRTHAATIRNLITRLGR